jgi:hypothetical protein
MAESVPTLRELYAGSLCGGPEIDWLSIEYDFRSGVRCDIQRGRVLLRAQRLRDPSAISRRDDLITNEVQPDELGGCSGIEVAMNCISHLSPQLVHRLCLGENGLSDGACREPTIRHHKRNRGTAYRPTTLKRTRAFPLPSPFSIAFGCGHIRFKPFRPKMGEIRL